METPKSGSKGLPTKQIAALVIVAVVALGGVYAVTTLNKPGPAAYGVTYVIQIYGAIHNSTANIPASYDPDNFTAFQGAKVTLEVWNTDNMTHGLEIPSLNLNTGPIQPNATAILTFTPTLLGNYTMTEPSSDCGGGNCDSGQDLNGFFLIDASS